MSSSPEITTNIKTDHDHVILCDQIRSAKSLIIDLYNLIKKTKKSKKLLITNPSTLTILSLPALKIFNPKLKIIFYDLILKKPSSIKERLTCATKSFCLRFIDHILSLHHDTSGYEKIFKIAPKKFIYIGFNANNYKLFINQDLPPLDNNSYYFSCGTSQRNFKVLCAAFSQIDEQLIILADKNRLLSDNFLINTSEIPSNVTWLDHRSSRDEYYELMLNSKGVIIPIIKDVIQPAGISVALEAAMLERPIFMSSGSTINKNPLLACDTFSPNSASELVTLLQKPSCTTTSIQSNKLYALSLGSNQDLRNRIIKTVKSL